MVSPKNLREPEIVDVRPVTHLELLAAQPRVCLQVRGAAVCSGGELTKVQITLQVVH